MSEKLFYNGSVLTMDSVQNPAAVLVRDGRIAAAGEEKEVLSKAEGTVEKIDLKGVFLMPSFIDAHSHFSGYAMSFLQVPLDETTNFEEIKERIVSYRVKNKIPKGQWIIAKGYDHNSLKEKRHPSLKILDEAAPDNPLVLQHKSSHMGVFNSYGLKELGITPDTESPAGGRIQKENGKLTGYMEENAFIEYFQKIPSQTVEKVAKAYQTAQDRYASYGITTVQEGMFVSQLIPFYQNLIEKDGLKLDLVAYGDAKEIGKLKEALPWRHDRYYRHLKLGGMKIFLDGSPQGRTAWMRKPYEGSSDYCGYPTLTEEQVEHFVQLAIDEKLQLLAHCNGDAAAEQYLKALLKYGSKIAELRPVMIHAQLFAPDQMAAAKKSGVIPSFFGAHVYHWGDVHIENFGMERASHISAAKSALNSGIPFTFHQDAPVIEPDMLETVWCAANRLTKKGVLLDAEAIPVKEALKAVTANAAYQYFEEKEKGSITPGKLADLVVLSENPLEISKEKIRDIRVLATFKEGNCIYHA